ncbi:hypothetical protein [Solilutibacter silvestris]|uniref:ATP-grasp domain-containing protein n=1 Tax=Solilutibacter silvestris TaxID=1645665 RepID=A0A2K1PZB5_9GAMM|nr:hypothetical protein [Lysobacter silvestris]PNS08138.1 ATP-grasp domain-containing protein [Lysobacter silvestris]
MDERIPALVMGAGFTGLGALRAIHDAGIPAWTACPPGDLAAHSRWFRPFFGTPAWDGSTTGVEQALARADIGPAVLIPCADDIADWVARNAVGGRVMDRYLASTSSATTMRILQDKARFADWLEGKDIAFPRTFTVHDDSDFDHLPFAQLDRVFIKPIDSQSFSRITGRKGVWVENARACRETWSQLQAQGHGMIVQEYVPGPVGNHVFVDGFRDRAGRYPGLFARRRTRIHPPDFGNSTFCRSIALEEIEPAVMACMRLLDQLDYRGIFSAEFKQDARDGEYRLLEVNTRAWWYVEFAARCGVNVCEMAWRDAQELPVAAVRRYRIGKGCVNWIEDANALKHARASITTALLDWPGAYEHVYRWNDPRPAIHRVSVQLRRSLARSVHLVPATTQVAVSTSNFPPMDPPP